MIRPAAALLAATLLATPALAQSPVGRWLTEDRGGVIEIFPRDGALYGRIVGLLKLTQDEPQPVDVQGRPRCRLELIQRLVENPSGEWFGKITNPEDGRVWDVRVTVDEAGNLRLRGFLLFALLGSTQVWTPYRGDLGADCRPRPDATRP